VAVLVQQQHACLEGDGDFFLGGAPVVGVEDCFAADAGCVLARYGMVGCGYGGDGGDGGEVRVVVVYNRGRPGVNMMVQKRPRAM
jgi:hypothetical protein